MCEAHPIKRERSESRKSDDVGGFGSLIVASENRVFSLWIEKQVLLMCYFYFSAWEISIWHLYYKIPELKTVSIRLDVMERMRQRGRLCANSLSAAQLIREIRVLLFKSA